MKRRKFLETAVGGAAALAAWPWLKAASQTPETVRPVGTPALSEDEIEARYSLMDEAITRPMFRKDLFASPVIIESVELLERDGNYLCRVRSKDGAEGISVGNYVTALTVNIMKLQVIPFFIGQDARELDRLLEWVILYRLNFRLFGLAIGIPVAMVEFAILDMMGKISGRGAIDLVGGIKNPEVGLYIATEFRERPLEEHFEKIVETAAGYDMKALKIKLGFMVERNRDINYKGIPGKSEKLIPMVREHFGDDWELFADANGYYGVEDAIRMGRILEENRYGYFEEPVMYNRFEDIKRVADALTIPIANSEQDQDFYNYRWLLAHDGVDIVEPDVYYFGGFIRSLRVANMAHALGKKCLTHMSGGNLGYLYNVIFASALSNSVDHHEFKGYNTHIPFECPTSSLEIVGGKMKAPTGPGLGIIIDPRHIARYKAI
ncbi:MAG: mandelate racemase/muconate lactonizing enzyme family protein [Alistipes sp.]|jgi:L-alanine-DL-glutamate epimerase-like enolase superfamily enzyme|nr:mandelate racemase/muconate lactonizing enzyme family protein [Alistipes sp.]